MALVDFRTLMRDAKAGGYAVGYFESWNLESLLAVADAAEAARSPVILGFSGIFLPHQNRVATDKLSHYAALGLDVCRNLSVPACLLFNECPRLDWIFNAIELGFQLVMFTDETLGFEDQVQRVAMVAAQAHSRSIAVEAELAPLPGAGGEAPRKPGAPRLTDPRQARLFVEATGIDALAVDIGQAHLHGRAAVRLDLEKLEQLRAAVDVPLVLHGASSVAPADLAEAVRRGIGKINVGSNLKRAYFEAMRDACRKVPAGFNPYEIIGSGCEQDVLMAGRSAMRQVVESLMRLFGSAGRA